MKLITFNLKSIQEWALCVCVRAGSGWLQDEVWFMQRCLCQMSLCGVFSFGWTCEKQINWWNLSTRNWRTDRFPSLAKMVWLWPSFREKPSVSRWGSNIYSGPWIMWLTHFIVYKVTRPNLGPETSPRRLIFTQNLWVDVETAGVRMSSASPPVYRTKAGNWEQTLRGWK